MLEPLAEDLTHQRVEWHLALHLTLAHHGKHAARRST
jgi:hypothetical protein